MTEAETIELQCEIRARSELAIMIHDGHKTVWIPRSEIVAMNVQEGTAGHPRATLTIPGWLGCTKQHYRPWLSTAPRRSQGRPA